MERVFSLRKAHWVISRRLIIILLIFRAFTDTSVQQELSFSTFLLHAHFVRIIRGQHGHNRGCNGALQNSITGMI